MYDEFGNYIGPDINGDSDDDDRQARSNSSDEDGQESSEVVR